MSFPADIKGCMKDCILSLFWPRKDIVGFFEKHGCTKAEIAPLQIEGENALKRHEVVDAGSQEPSRVQQRESRVKFRKAPAYVELT